MDNSISITFGTPKHGWLPVDFRYQDFHLDFEASDVLNDPIEELLNAVTKIQDNEIKQIIWWLEPAAYFFDIEKKEQNFTLKIIEADDLHNETAMRGLLLTVKGNEKEIIMPFCKALKHFSTQTYEENHWPHHLDKDKLGRLIYNH